MKRFLQSIVLFAAMALPLASMAQGMSVVWSHDFDASTSFPSELTKKQGLVNDVLAGTASLTGTGNWSVKTASANQGFASNHAFNNVYGTGRKDWMITPAISLGGTNPELAFDLALTAYSGTGSPAPATNGVDDKFAVLVSTDNMASWTLVCLWDNAGADSVYNNIPAAGEHVVLSLNAFAGQNINVAFYVESTLSNADNNLHVDNIAVSEFVSCMRPSDLVASATSNSISMSWTAGGSETSWIAYAIAANGTVDSMAVSTTSCTFTGLQANTAYTLGVRAVCSASDISGMLMGEIRTECAEMELPYFNNFDSEVNGSSSHGNTDFVFCWNRLLHNPGANAYAYPYVASTSGINGSKGLYFSQSSSVGSYYAEANLAVLPQVNTTTYPINTLRFIANYKSSSANPMMVVGVMTDPNDYTTFVGVDTIVPTGNTWINHITYFTNYTGAGSYIAIAHPINGSYNTIYVDEVALEEAPSCLEPTALHVTSVTTSTATLAWTVNGTETEWMIRYKAASDSNWTVEPSVTTNPYTVTGLNSNTYYQFEVLAACSASEQSPWSLSAFANTECDVFMLSSTNPYTEDFEDAGFPTACWKNFHVSGPGSQLWQRSTTKAHSGSASVKATDQSAVTRTNLVTGLLNVPQANTYQVRFWVYRENDYPTKLLEGIRVWASTTSDTADGVVIGYIHRNYTLEPAEASAGWYEYDMVIPTAGDQFIIFEGINEYGNATFMDDLSIEEAPSCLRPTNLAVAATTTTTATLTWSLMGTEGEWNIRYKQTADTTWTMIESGVYDTTYTLTGLTPATNYEVQVRSFCSGIDQSEWTTSTLFATECDIFALSETNPYVQDFEDAAFPPICWQNFHVTGPGSALWASTNYRVHSGSHSIKITDQSATTRTNLVTGLLNVPEANAYQVNCWIYRENDYATKLVEGIRIWASTTNDTADGVVLGYIHRNHTLEPVEDAAGWKEYSFMIPSAGNQYIIFEGINEYGNATYMDDLTIEYVDAPAPSIDTLHQTISLIDEGSYGSIYYVDMANADTSIAFSYEFSAQPVNGVTYDLDDMESASLVDYNTYAMVNATAATFMKNVSGDSTIIEASMLAGDTLYMLHYLHMAPVVPPTIDTVYMTMALYEAEDYGDEYVVAMAPADTSVVLQFQFDAAPVNGTVYTQADMQAFGMIYTTMTYIMPTQATYVQNLVGNTFTINATMLDGNTYYVINYTETIGSSEPDTIEVVADNYDYEYYAADNDWYINLANDDYEFYFDIVADSIVSGHTYTLADMLDDYSDGFDYVNYDAITYTAAQYTQTVNGDTLRVNAYVTATTGDVYHITYFEVVDNTIDTVYMTMALYEAEDYGDEYVVAMAPADTSVVFQFQFIATPGNGNVYTLADNMQAFGMIYSTMSYIMPTQATYVQNLAGNTFTVNATMLAGNTYYVLNYTETMGSSELDTVYMTMALYATVEDNDQYAVGLALADTSLAYEFVFDAAPVNGTVYTLANMQAFIVNYQTSGITMPTQATYVQNLVGDTFTVNATLLVGNTYYVVNYTETMGSSEPDSATITVVAADATMGTVTGSGRYEVGETITITAVANAGFHFVSWNDGNTEATRQVVVTADATYTATFEADQVEGIDDVMGNITIATRGHEIVIAGADNQNLVIFDVQGRIIVRESNMTATAYPMTATGVYLVKVGNYPAKKVVIVR